MCQHFDKFGHHRHCDSGNLMFLIFHVTSCDYKFKRLCEVLDGGPSQ